MPAGHLRGRCRRRVISNPAIGEVLRYETAKYYANILWPFSANVGKVIKKVSEFEKPISIIAPDHGPIWRENVDWVLNLYTRWINRTTEKRAVIVYATMWQSTATMARSIAEGLDAEGVKVTMCPLSKTHRSDVATQLLEASTLIVGCPNLNSGMFPTIADILTYMKGLKPKKHELAAAAFGSYGWSPAAAKQATSFLEEMNCEILSDPLQIKWRPDGSNLEQCYEFGRNIGQEACRIATAVFVHTP